MIIAYISKWWVTLLMCLPLATSLKLIPPRFETIKDDNSISQQYARIEAEESEDIWKMNNLLPSNCNTQDTEQSGTENEVRFWLHSRALPWMEALASCWAEGGRLATPLTVAEAKALGRLLVAMAPNVTETEMRDAVYVGLNDFARQGRWMTCDGRHLGEVGYATWLGGSGRSPQRNCRALLADGRYVQQHCGQRLAYACEYDTSVADPTPSTGAEGYAATKRLGLVKLHEEPTPWFEAVAECEREGAHMTAPGSRREAQLLASSFNNDSTTSGYFIGINDLAEEGRWHTISGRSLVNSGPNIWAEGQPDGGRANNCGVLLPDGSFATAPCSQPMPFCCTKDSRTVTAADVTDDYKAIEDLGRYHLHTKGQDWMAALSECRRENASLAVPNSEQEAQALASMLRETQRLRMVQNREILHVGIHDLDRNGAWTTIFGKTLGEAGYENWSRQYPENNGNNCVMMDSNGLYFNFPCGNRYAFVCEKPL